MEIVSLGHSAFKIRGKQAVVVTDPYDPQGLKVKLPKHLEADIVTVSHEHKDHNAVSSVEGSPFVVHGPGEYEIKGVSIIGVTSYHDENKGEERGKNTMYRITIDGIVVAHLGDLGHVLSSAQADTLDGVDILLIPVGNKYTIDAQKAMQVVSDISPKVVIPMHDARSNPDLAPLSDFFKAMNKEEIAPIAKYSVNKDKLPAEMQIVVLE